MEEKQKNILDRNSSLLENNVILTPDFYDLLQTENVLPETMLKDIQSKKTQQERNAKLIETLKLRGADSFRKFRHILYLTGHLFLADHFYGEDIETKVLKAEDIFGKFPTVFKHVSDDMKSKMLRFLETKVREKALTNAWLKGGQDRCEILEAKKEVFETEKELRMRLRNKSKKVIQLSEDLTQMSEELQRRDEGLSVMKKEVEKMRSSFKEDLSKQTRFNAANNNSIIQLRDRFNTFNDRVRVLNLAIREFLDSDETTEHEDDPDNMKISLLEKNVRKLMHTARFNMETSSSSINERERVMKMLKLSSRNKQQALSEVVKQYIDKQEKAKNALSNEIDLLLDGIRGNRFTARLSTKPKADLKIIKSQLATVKEEVEHMKKKIEWKDNQISDLIQENTILREQVIRTSQQPVTLPKIQSRRISRDSIDSNVEMDKIYQQFDRYVGESMASPLPISRRRRGSLADVNLERDVSPPVAISRNRRDSRIETSDLDILGTTSIARRRSSMFGPDVLQNNKDAEGDNGKPKPEVYRSSADGQYGVGLRRTSVESSVGDNLKVDSKKSKETRGEPAYAREGRRPSLAELITIYEQSSDDTTHLADKGQEKVKLLQTVEENEN